MKSTYHERSKLSCSWHNLTLDVQIRRNQRLFFSPQVSFIVLKVACRSTSLFLLFARSVEPVMEISSGPYQHLVSTSYMLILTQYGGQHGQKKLECHKILQKYDLFATF